MENGGKYERESGMSFRLLHIPCTEDQQVSAMTRRRIKLLTRRDETNNRISICRGLKKNLSKPNKLVNSDFFSSNIQGGKKEMGEA